MKTLTNSKNCSKSQINFLFRLSFALIGRFFPVYIHSRLSEQFSRLQTGFGTTFRDTGGYQKAGNKLSEEGYWKEFHNYSDFVEASRNFILDFLHKKTIKIVLIQKVLLKFFGPSKNIHLVALFL